ncbi:MAG: hypothetical protein FJY10_11065, partial [Bacteroidetes bacterium]|nr:hypothetical protein [Bacteroidota bacterium]
MIKNLSILGFILSCIMLEAQHPFSLQGDQEAKTLSFSHLTRMNGLPSNRVREMVQDFQGYIWIATDNGLARYDGKIIKVFQRRENDPSSLCDNGVFSLMEAGDSLIWVGTGDGISIYNPLTGDFRSFTCFGKKGSLFPVQGV